MHWNGWAGRIFLPRFFNFDFQKSNPVRFSERRSTEIAKACYEMGKGENRCVDCY